MRKQKKIKNNGSALILVVIVTVLLSVIGIIFVMTMRIREMTTANVADDRDLDTAVGAVTEKIETVLQQDLFGTNLKSSIINGGGGNEPYDSTGASDRWLSSLEPTWMNDNGTPADPTDDNYQWDWITNLYNTPQIWNKICGIVEDYQKFTAIVSGPADADGDGVADSMWAKVPDISTSRAKPVFAAVRIIDNCAMLNLNTAFCFYQKPNTPADPNWYLRQEFSGSSNLYGVVTPYGWVPAKSMETRHYGEGGRYLSEISYLSFLRGNDLIPNPNLGWYRILAAKRMATIDNAGLLTAPYPLPDNIHNTILMNIENPGPAYNLFDIGDELEIRNRFTLTSKTVSRFERSDVANFTLDSGGGLYAVLETPVDDATAFKSWKAEMNPANFDPAGTGPNPGYYDRRHVCTFYSFDRNIRSGAYWLLDTPIANYRQTNPTTADALEGVFRPLKNQPIDLRAMTDLAKLDNIVWPDAAGSNLIDCHRNILHLLYAFRVREYWALSNIGGGPAPNALIMSARKAAQQVANIIDYMDDDTALIQTGPFGMVASSMDAAYGSQANANPTYINKAIIDAMLAEVSLADSGGALVITPAWPSYNDFDFGLPAGEVVYGYERQPFISEVYCNYIPVGGAQGLALELLNPYKDTISLDGWRITIGSINYPLTAAFSVPGGTSTSPGRLVIYAGAITPLVPKGSPVLAGFGLGTVLNGNILRLQRPKPDAPGSFLIVDETDPAQSTFLLGGSIGAGDYVSSRDDKEWKFTNRSAYVNNHTATLGAANNVMATPKGYQLPVENVIASLDRLADFQKITWVDPNGLTGQIATASATSGEGKIRYDSQVDTDMLHYICTLSRGEKGIPGRININTAPVYVIAAAIPPQLVMTTGDPNTALTLAQDIVSHRPSAGYTGLEELLDIPAMTKYGLHTGLVGDPNMSGDLEERDWIFNRLSNIFTVRSDTFTAYILVRLGTDGPQRRMIAIFDRSNCWTAADKPRLVALHPVPDPR